MKKLVAVLVFGVALMGTIGLSTRVDAQPETDLREPTDAEVNAALDKRARELLAALRQAQAEEARTAALHR